MSNECESHEHLIGMSQSYISRLMIQCVPQERTYFVILDFHTMLKHDVRFFESSNLQKMFCPCRATYLVKMRQSYDNDSLCIICFINYNPRITVLHKFICHDVPFEFDNTGMYNRSRNIEICWYPPHAD